LDTTAFDTGIEYCDDDIVVRLFGVRERKRERDSKVSLTKLHMPTTVMKLRNIRISNNHTFPHLNMMAVAYCVEIDCSTARRRLDCSQRSKESRKSDQYVERFAQRALFVIHFEAQLEVVEICNREASASDSNWASCIVVRTASSAESTWARDSSVDKIPDDEAGAAVGRSNMGLAGTRDSAFDASNVSSRAVEAHNFDKATILARYHLRINA